jgi:cbb3-type cytochrome oxidase maturation protein
MEILYLLIPLGLLLMALAASVLVWAFSAGQYDDLDAWSQRMPDAGDD